MKIHPRLFFGLTFTFIIMTVVGTLSHEGGHYLTSRALGYEARINYQSSKYWNPERDSLLDYFYSHYSHEIKNNLDFPEKEAYETASQKYRADSLLITIGGPVQTMLTGTIGLILLVLYRKKIVVNETMTNKGWALVLMTLFWLRQLANLVVATAGYILSSRSTGAIHGDEKVIAFLLNLPLWSIQISTGIISAGVLLYTLIIIPTTQRLTFMLAGLTGGVLGYYLWLIQFGKVIMP